MRTFDHKTDQEISRIQVSIKPEIYISTVKNRKKQIEMVWTIGDQTNIDQETEKEFLDLVLKIQQNAQSIARVINGQTTIDMKGK